KTPSAGLTVELGADPFKGNPVIELQEKITAEPRLDGVLLESAWFNEEGRMEIRVLGAGDQQAEVKELLKKVEADAQPKFENPAWLPKETKWSALSRGLQQKLAAEKDLLGRHTRVDRLYFAYDGPGSALRLHVKGVCIHLRKGDDKEKVSTQLQEK